MMRVLPFFITALFLATLLLIFTRFILPLIVTIVTYIICINVGDFRPSIFAIICSSYVLAVEILDNFNFFPNRKRRIEIQECLPELPIQTNDEVMWCDPPQEKVKEEALVNC